MLTPVLRQQPFEILGVDGVRLLLYQVFDSLLFLLVRSSDRLSDTRLGDGGRFDSILVALLYAVLLV